MSCEDCVSNAAASFGRQVVQAATPTVFLELEEREGRRDQFAVIDALTETLLRRSLRGEPVAVLTADAQRNVSLELVGLDDADAAFLAHAFALAAQQQRGAWFLPEAATLDAGWANFPFHLQTQPRFATGITAEERGKVSFRSSAGALFFWAVLEPLFEQLYYPFALRGPLAGTKDQAWQRSAWREAEVFLAALGFDVGDVLAPIRFGGGWSKLRAPAQVQAKQALMEALRQQSARPHAARYRAYQIQRLLSRYYQQAKKGPPKFRSVLTKDLQRVLAGFFGGDWLAFLAYIDEEPHPDEQIATALPETRLVVADRDRVAAVATAHDLSAAEIERVLAAFWGTDRAASPVEPRVDALRAYWRELDAIHARQRSGMPPLWGLVDDMGVSLAVRAPYQPGLYRALLTPQLLAEIDRLWGACMLTRWPDRIVSPIAPHALLAEAFGPALTFWQGCSLTAWFLCEGPSSRTDLAGLADYHARDLAALERLGCPVDPALFDELRAAERLLGPPRRIPDPAPRIRQDLDEGISLTVEVSIGMRRDGFERLRDIMTRHRRSWSEQHFEAYLRARWETEIRDAARAFHLVAERKGKAPNPKQFAPHAAMATNHWFGGDLSALYRMMGEKSPFEPTWLLLMPADREAFAQSVYQRLIDAAQALPINAAAGAARDDEEPVRLHLQRLAEESIRFVQREEVFGRPPTLEEFGREGFAYRASSLSPELAAAWSMYQQAIMAAQRSPLATVGDLAPPMRPAQPPPLAEPEGPAIADARSEPKPFWRRLFRSPR